MKNTHVAIEPIIPASGQPRRPARTRIKRKNPNAVAAHCGYNTNITPADVNEFEEGLTKAGVDNKILRYDAPHAFANPSSARYVQDAAEDAWKHARAFLTTNLKPPKPPKPPK